MQAFAGMTVDQLKVEMRKRSLKPSNHRKAQLLAILIQYDATQPRLPQLPPQLNIFQPQIQIQQQMQQTQQMQQQNTGLPQVLPPNLHAIMLHQNQQNNIQQNIQQNKFRQRKPATWRICEKKREN
jgi:hypothetical protein